MAKLVLSNSELNKFERKVASLKGNSTVIVANALNRGAILVHSEAITTVQKGGRSGEVYKRKKIEHQASAAGEAPKSDTGNLAKNIVLNAAKKKGAQLIATVESRASYSRALEYGTRKMEPRPFMQPSYEKHKARIIEMVTIALRIALKGA